MSVLPATQGWWPVQQTLEVLEDGRPLGPRVERSALLPAGAEAEASYAVVVTGGWKSPRQNVLYFVTDDGRPPRANGKVYVVRYPRRQLPATWALLATIWLGVPVAVSSIRKRRARFEFVEPMWLGTSKWSIGLASFGYALFAIQATLNDASLAWWWVVAGVVAASSLSKLSRGQWTLPRWSWWVAGLSLWAIGSFWLPGSWASQAVLGDFLITTGLGVLVFQCFRGELAGVPRLRGVMFLSLFVLFACLSLARQAGLDPASGLALLGADAPSGTSVVNPWTTKFIGHWLVVLGWCTVAAVGRFRFIIAAPTLLLAATALLLNGSKSALGATIVSSAIATLALKWPRQIRRLFFGVLMVGVLASPWLAGVPWRIQTELPARWAEGVVGALEMDIRGGVWEYSRKSVFERPLFGRGIGATRSIPGKNVTIAEALWQGPQPPPKEIATHPVFAGGHPHNVALLIWLDFGFVGAVLLVGFLAAVCRAIGVHEREKGTHSGLLGLVAATAALLLFNYPVWHPTILSSLWMSAALASAGLRSPGEMASEGPASFRSRLSAG